jgi:hypothetical protein
MALVLLTWVTPLHGQKSQRVGATDVRSEPRGVLLARTTVATDLPVVSTRNGWRAVRLRGWVSTSLLKRDSRDGFDLVVTADNARLRSAPTGRELAQLHQGMLLKRLGSRGAWTQVERQVWVPAAAISARAPATVAAAPRARSTGTDQPQAYQAPRGGGPVSTSSAASRDSSVAAVAQMAALRNTGLLSAPDAGQVGTLRPGAPVRVLSSAAGWSRVQLEGWVRTDDLVTSDSAAQGVTAAEVRANPERFLGKEVEWRIQFISTASADELRPEMPPGQPYMLARGPLPEPGFVYVMLSREDSTRVASLPALAELTIRARVRAARTRFLATPVVELVAILPSDSTR